MSCKENLRFFHRQARSHRFTPINFVGLHVCSVHPRHGSAPGRIGLPMLSTRSLTTGAGVRLGESASNFAATCRHVFRVSRRRYAFAQHRAFRASPLRRRWHVRASRPRPPRSNLGSTV